MPKYKISYTTEDWWTLEIDATDMDDAMDKFHNGVYHHEDAVRYEGGYLQESVEIEEIP